MQNPKIDGGGADAGAGAGADAGAGAGRARNFETREIPSEPRAGQRDFRLVMTVESARHNGHSFFLRAWSCLRQGKQKMC